MLLTCGRADVEYGPALPSALPTHLPHRKVRQGDVRVLQYSVNMFVRIRVSGLQFGEAKFCLESEVKSGSQKHRRLPYA